MAIAFDAFTFGSSAGSLLTFNITVAVGATTAVIFPNEAGGGAAVSVTVGGVAAVKTGSDVIWSGGSVRCNAWVAVGIPSGTVSVSITYAAATVCQATVMTFSGVDQTTPIDTAMTSTNAVGAAPTLGITPSNSGAMICAALWAFTTAGTITASNNTTLRGQNSASFDGACGTDGPLVPASARTEGFTFTSTTYCLMVLALKATAATTLVKDGVGCGRVPFAR